MSAITLLKKLPEIVIVDAIDGLECTVQLNLSAPVHVKICDGACTVEEGASENPDVTLTLSDENMIALLKGNLNAVTAFMMGKVKVDGDLMLAKDFSSFFDNSKIAA